MVILCEESELGADNDDREVVSQRLVVEDFYGKQRRLNLLGDVEVSVGSKASQNTKNINTF